MTPAPTTIGIVGCGTISGAYLRACAGFDGVDVVAVADLDHERAVAKAKEFGVPRAVSVPDLLADPGVDIILNLTIPSAHADIAKAALEGGRSVYNEKPLAIDFAGGRAIVESAEARGLRVGCAPDTFLGGGLQTCRKLIDDGVIGEPVAAAGAMLGHGPESWHPDPSFFYEPGAGPLFDMAPYYLTALVSLLGPIRRVGGLAAIGIPERTITSKPRFGEIIRPKTPTHVASVLEFGSGAVGTLTTSFEVWASERPKLEIYGTEGTLSVPDPNTFAGPVRLKLAGDEDWSEVPLTHANTSDSRGIGVLDMAAAMAAGTRHRASGELALHVLEAMETILAASKEGRVAALTTTCDRPAPIPAGLADGEVPPAPTAAGVSDAS